MYEEIFFGFSEELRDYLKVFFVDEKYEELVLVKDILFYLCCEYYLVFFFGKVYIVYLLKGGRFIGFFKFVRVIDILVKRL